MEARRYTLFDYNEVASWWAAHKFPSIPPNYLPKVGYIVDGLSAGFLYQTDSAVAMLEWCVSNPDAPKERRREALDAVIEALLNEARRMGFRMVYSELNHPGLIERYLKHGFVKGDSGMTTMIRSFS